jgi:hypothetical protein
MERGRQQKLYVSKKWVKVRAYDLKVNVIGVK